MLWSTFYLPGGSSIKHSTGGWWPRRKTYSWHSLGPHRSQSTSEAQHCAICWGRWTWCASAPAPAWCTSSIWASDTARNPWPSAISIGVSCLKFATRILLRSEHRSRLWWKLPPTTCIAWIQSRTSSAGSCTHLRTPLWLPDLWNLSSSCTLVFSTIPWEGHFSPAFSHLSNFGLVFIGWLDLC